MSFLSALMVYSSVNNLTVISGRFINVCVKPVLSRTYKVSSYRTQHFGPVESQTSGHSDTTLGYIGDLQLNYSTYEKSLGKYIPPDSAKTQRVVYSTFNIQTSPQ